MCQPVKRERPVSVDVIIKYVCQGMCTLMHPHTVAAHQPALGYTTHRPWSIVPRLMIISMRASVPPPPPPPPLKSCMSVFSLVLRGAQTPRFTIYYFTSHCSGGGWLVAHTIPRAFLSFTARVLNSLPSVSLPSPPPPSLIAVLLPPD